MKILRLTLMWKWWEQIRRGEKKVEYRDIKPYWTKRLIGKKYDAILFVNGYGNHRPKFLIELEDIRTDVDSNKYELLLGKILRDSR